MTRGTTMIRSGHITALVLLAFAVSVMLDTTPAAARSGRVYAGSFGGAATSIVDPYPLGQVSAIAVDTSTDSSQGDVYVADAPDNRVEKFDADGRFLLMFGKDVNKTAVEEARPEDEQDVCPAPGHADDVCQDGVAAPTPGAIEAGLKGNQSISLAVDSSSGPSQGDVYVGEHGGGANEQQEIELKPTSVRTTSGGSFRLTFEGQTTSPLRMDAPPAEVQTALSSLSTIGVGNVKVVGAPEGGVYTYGVEFTGALAVKAVPQLGIATSGLPAGASGVTAITRGSSPGALPNVMKFDSSGSLITSWGADGRIDGSGIASPPAAAPGPVLKVEALAVDTSGNLWVKGAYWAEEEALHLENENGATAIAHLAAQRPALYEFAEGGGFASDWITNSDFSPVGEALFVNGATDIYAAEIGGGGRPPNEYSASGAFLGYLDTEKTYLPQSYVLEPSSGDFDVYTKERESSKHALQRYPSSCVQEEPGACAALETFVSPNLSTAGRGLAIGPTTPSDTLYLGTTVGESPGESPEIQEFAVATLPEVRTSPASGFTATTATLNGTVNPSGVALRAGSEGCRFEWGETTAYGKVAPCGKTAAQLGSGNAPVEVSAGISGLSAGHSYHYRLVASNTNELDESQYGADSSFGPPATESASVTEVTSSSAILQAEIDPQNIDTHYRFEYGTQPGVYEDASLETDLGAAGDTQTVAFRLQGLSAHALYYYRVVASNALGASASAQQTFVTQGSGALSLLDGRAWEMVSPPEKNGATFFPIYTQGVVQAAASGDAVTYMASATIEAGAEGAGNETQVLSAREGAKWVSRDIAPPHRNAVGYSLYGEEFRFFSEDLATAVVQPKGRFESEWSAEASEQTAFLRDDFSPVDPPRFCALGCMHPVVTGVPGIANVPEGVHFGSENGCQSAQLCGPQFVAGTADARHLILSSEVGLTESLGDRGGLYEYSRDAAPAEQIRLVSVRPEGQPESAASLGGRDNARNAISADGSRVVWAESGQTAHLYLRYNATMEQSGIEGGACVEPEKACTIQLDKVQGGSGEGGAQPFFQDASANDERIFFTDEQALVPGAGGKHGPDLYECHIVRHENGTLGCELHDLTPETDGEDADVEGEILGTSADGSYTYFVANGRLTSEANQRGEKAQPGSCRSRDTLEPEAEPFFGLLCNLYVEHEGRIGFIGNLSNEDYPSFGTNGLADLTARVTPNGRWLAFMSKRSLTGYDNRDAANGKHDEEVFLYHAPAGDGEQGTLICASCNPTGARPRGKEFHQLDINQGGLVGGDRVWEQTDWIAANVPGWTPYDQAGGDVSLYQSRYLSNEGRLFFNSSDALVPQDTNNQEDVYEYEPVGVASCTATSQTYSGASGGCVDLISSGTSPGESAFLDASENGDDVFFLTAAKLAPQDTDTAIDVYDAHVCSAEAPCPTPAEPGPPPCQGDACQQPVEPPAELIPGSLTFDGPGDELVAPVSLGASTAGTASRHKPKADTRKLARALLACRRSRSKGRRKACEHRARARYAARAKRTGAKAHTGR